MFTNWSEHWETLIAMDRAVSIESSLRATLMVHVYRFENCHDCTETLIDAILLGGLVTEYEKQQIQQKKGQIKRNR